MNETRRDMHTAAAPADFGERFVSGYKAISTVDMLMNAPFDE